MRRSTVLTLFHLLLFCALSEQKLNITGCQKEIAYNVLDNNQSSLTCTGLQALSNIYWSFTGPSSNGTEIRLGECYACNTSCSINNCSVVDTDFDVSRRNTNFTTLRFVRNVKNIHGGLIKCSQFDNNSNFQAYCVVRKDNTSPEVHIPDCSSGSLEVSENQSVSLTCTGLWPVSNTSWSITHDNDADVSLGNCSLCYQNCSSKPCKVADPRYSISRSRFDVTTLEFLPDIHDHGSVTVKCSQLYSNKTVHANCTIMIPQGNTTTIAVTQTTTNDTSQSSGTSAFPLVLVAGGAGAATLVVLFIIVVVVVVKRSKQKKGPTGSEENLHTSGTELDVMSTQNYSDQNNKDGARTSNILHLSPTANPSAHPKQAAPQPMTAVVPNESSAVRNSTAPTRYTDGYTYVDISDVPAARTSLNAEQPRRVAFQPDALNMKTRFKGDNHTVVPNESSAVRNSTRYTDGYTYVDISDVPAARTSFNAEQPPRRVVFQPDALNMKTPTKGDNPTEDDSVDYTTNPNDRIGKGASHKYNKRSFKVDDDNACKPIARAHTVGPRGDVYSQVNKVRQTVAAKPEKAGYSRDQSPKKQTTEDNVNGADNLQDQKGEDGRVYANLAGTTAYDNVIVANTNGERGTSKGDDADGNNVDDEYNRLQYHRPDPQDDPQYSHIARL